MQFSELFNRATNGLAPFAYQVALAEGEDLPRVVSVPTGAGKTAAAILGWLYRRRYHPNPAVCNSTPRRLAYCLPTRVLVEQTATAARTWLDGLDLLGTEPGQEGRVSVHLLMGGETDNDWDAWPDREAILVGTQDQLVSRALNRGYAMSRSRWPIHCGLLNNDVLWVFDEVQLMGPALSTSLQLQGLREKWGAVASPQSLWMSATLDAGNLLSPDFAPVDLTERTLCLSDADVKNRHLAKRLSAAKPLLQCAVTNAKGKGYDARSLAEAIRAAHVPGTRTIVVLNRVRRAQDVYRHLKRAYAKNGSAPELLLLHSRFRSAERRELEQRLPPAPGAEGCIVVATQTVEAGVDISCRTMFTELAPWSSLVQRFGRCNRYGECGADGPAAVHWVDVQDDPAPYTADELSVARELLAQVSDVGITGLAKCSLPPSRPGVSDKWQVLRATDFLELFDTTPDLDGHDIDVAPYIRASDDLDVFVFWREYDTKGSIDESKPQPEELCPVGINDLRKAVTQPDARLSAMTWDSLDAKWVRLDAKRLYPGMTVMLNSQGGCYAPETGWDPSVAEPVSVVAPVDAVAPEAYESDPWSEESGRRITLREHTDDVALEIQALLVSLPHLAAFGPHLLQAARWHDVGKAHPVFQEWLRSGGGLPDDQLWAKAPEKLLHKPRERRYFRHELASGLAALQAGQDYLVAYLAAAHHGKVRMLIRSLPSEPRPRDASTRFARGVWEGDELPAVDLGDGESCPETTLSLLPMELGETEAGPSWLARALELRDEIGPFGLTYLEAILRVADWRASAKEANNGD